MVEKRVRSKTSKKKAPTKRRNPSVPSSPTNQYGLSGLQYSFLQQYPLHRFNGTKAAIAAGYAGKNAANWASRTLRTPKIREALQDMMQQDAHSLELSRSILMSMLWDMANSDLVDLGNNPGGGGNFRYKELAKMSSAERAALGTITHTSTGKMSIENYKMEAIKLLLKATGAMEPPKTEDSKGAFSRWVRHQEGKLGSGVPVKPGDPNQTTLPGM